MVKRAKAITKCFTIELEPDDMNWRHFNQKQSAVNVYDDKHTTLSDIEYFSLNDLVVLFVVLESSRSQTHKRSQDGDNRCLQLSTFLC